VLSIENVAGYLAIAVTWECVFSVSGQSSQGSGNGPIAEFGYEAAYSIGEKFPAIRRDLAVVVDESVTLDELRKSVNLAAKGLLRELRVFDVYRGKGIEPGRKSIALGLILQETSRTLTDDEADAVIAAVIERVKGDLKAGIRE
jgi:phenylalanyl-tRNA synthetase beta chain